MTSSTQMEGIVFAGESPFAERLRVQVRRIAPHFRTALLIGEPGCGKADVARELHKLSPVASGPCLSCSAEEFATGVVDEVRFGTLFLEHLGALRPALQDQLLLRLKRLDSRLGGETRLIVANDVHLRGIVAAGRMRQELFARVAAIELRVPPLRDRLEDLPAMLAHFTAPPVTQEVMALFRDHSWPGNLRELREVLSKAFTASDGHTLELRHLESFRIALHHSSQKPAAEVRLEFVMQRHVADVLERCSGNKLRAAEMLGISRSTLYRMLDAASTNA